jgi:deoxyribonuclease V
VGEGVRPLRDHVGDLVWQVSPGTVTTYGDLARALGDIVAARAVAKMVNEDLDPESFPTHRVVRKDGTVGGHPLGEREKAHRLEAEGVPVEDDRIPGMGAFRRMDFETDRPLRELRRVQATLGDRLNLGPLGSRPRTLIGVDVAYPSKGPAEAAAISVDPESMNILETRWATVDVDFPYIPTYLAFREMPAIETVVEGVDQEGSLLFVDGQGTLHPRGFGIACHVGVALGIPTIGVAKRLLCGSYDTAVLRREGHAAVMVEGRPMGWAIAPHGNEKRAVFASPGHMVSSEDALEIVLRSLGKRQPKPLELAHAAATAARKEAHSTTSRRP